MAGVPRIAVTGIGPISAIGIGKKRFWESILAQKTNVKLEEIRIDNELWDKYYFHKVEDFDIGNFGIEKDKLDEITEWKEGEKIRDLEYLLASIKLALDDSKLDYKQENNGIGLVLAHENLGLMPFGLKVSNISYELLIGKTISQIFSHLFCKFLKFILRTSANICFIFFN